MLETAKFSNAQRRSSDRALAPSYVNYLVSKAQPQPPKCKQFRQRFFAGVSPVEFLSNRAELPLLELANCNPAPSVGTADHRAVHEPQHRPLPERMRDAMTQRKTQMS